MDMNASCAVRLGAPYNECILGYYKFKMCLSWTLAGIEYLVSLKVNALAALPLGKEPKVHIVLDAGWAAELI
jgi:hypothetical protein